MAPVKSIKKYFSYTIVLFPWLGLLFVSPILGTVAINKYSRNSILQTWSHWISEQRNATAVFCGDSLISGGGHWGPRIGLGYFTTLNLAGNGYTIRQITSQVKKANRYQPKYIQKSILKKVANRFGYSQLEAFQLIGTLPRGAQAWNSKLKSF